MKSRSAVAPLLVIFALRPLAASRHPGSGSGSRILTHSALQQLAYGTQQLAYGLLHTAFSRGEVLKPQVAVFMIGLPGSGKSRVINRRYDLERPNYKRPNRIVVLDLDVEILKHPDYDPADPDKLYLASDQAAYKWADSRVEARFRAALANPDTRRVILDGTGTNLERQIRRMQQARAAGFFVKALYVRVPARTAIARAAMRTRGVKPARILAYQAKMKLAMQVAAEHADEVETVDVPFDDHRAEHADVGSITVIAQ